MLKIVRSRPTSFFKSPEYLRRREELFAWLRRPREERRQRRVPIDEELLDAKQITSALIHDFDSRCAFCESERDVPITPHHFRPLREPEPRINDADDDHYAWLAYEWLNMFLVCMPCARAKDRWFPVDGARANYMATLSEVRRREANRLIDPTRESPRSHFRFLIGGYCVPLTARGRVTVDVAQLNRPDLVKRREAAFEHMLRRLGELGNNSPWSNEDSLSRGPFPGARSIALKRILTEAGLGSLHSGALDTIDGRIDAYLSGAGDEARSRLRSTIKSLRELDAAAARQFEREAQQPFQPDLQDHYEPMPAPVGRPDFAHEIRTIRIENFRAINKLELTLPPMRDKSRSVPCLMLLGENAVGKSSTLGAIALALLGSREAHRLRLSYDMVARSVSNDAWDQLAGETVKVSVSFHDRPGVAEYIFDPDLDAATGAAEPSARVLGYGPHRYFTDGKVARDPRPAGRVRSLFEPGRPIAYPAEWLRDLPPRRFDLLARAIRPILPIGDEDQLVNDERYGICVQAGGRLTPIDRLSEGYRSVLAMVVDMMRTLLDDWPNLEDARAVVLIDEIEAHLHPRWKMQLMTSLRRALPRVQFITTTHDPLCLRGMDDGEVVVLQRDADNKIRQVPDLPPISGMRAEQILTSDLFGLFSTTDTAAEATLTRLGQRTADDPGDIGAEAEALIERITIGDSAAAQVLHEALRRYLDERERPAGGLGAGARTEAVEEVIATLRAGLSNAAA